MPVRAPVPATSHAGDAPFETLNGSVESIVFRNEQTGYSVLGVRLAGSAAQTANLVGNCAAVWVGEEITAEGRWVRHARHGLQFHCDSITCVAPTSTEGIRRYLGSGMIRGIGKVNAERLVSHFGAETLEVIEKSSRRLEEVEGIGPVRRQRIKESWNAQRGIRDIMIFLQSHGIGTGQAARIYRQYGGDAIALIQQDPYRLYRDVWGIGFKTADALALRVGIPRESLVRAQAGLNYALFTLAESGHCYCPEPELLLETQAMLNIPVELLAEALNAEIAAERLVRENDRIYLLALHAAETLVAERLRRLSDCSVAFRPIRAEQAVAWAEERMHIQLAPKQREALTTSLESKISVITGGPGVGKTTIILALTEVFGARKLNVKLAAPTGRAAKRMSEATGHDAQTLHRLLKYNPRRHAFDHNRENPIPADGFILDESSMIDIRLMSQFLEALRDDAFLVLVGDIDQLPSVGPGRVLADIIESGSVPCRRLTAIFRQDASGLIVRNAHRVNQGEFITGGDDERDSDFFFIQTEDPELMLERTRELVAERIPRRFGFDPLTDIQVLSPMRRNRLGADSLNTMLQATLNPDGPSLERFGVAYRVGDRVMQIRNNYDKDVFNGDIGRIQAVDEAEASLVVLFDGRPVSYEHIELDELSLAYACSIHKSQGSEYPAVVVLLATQHYKLLQRNLLYTAITRGRRLVCLVGSNKAVAIAIHNATEQPRRTSLAERLRNF